MMHPETHHSPSSNAVLPKDTMALAKQPSRWRSRMRRREEVWFWSMASGGTLGPWR